MQCSSSLQWGRFVANWLAARQLPCQQVLENRILYCLVRNRKYEGAESSFRSLFESSSTVVLLRRNAVAGCCKNFLPQTAFLRNRIGGKKRSRLSTERCRQLPVRYWLPGCYRNIKHNVFPVMSCSEKESLHMVFKLLLFSMRSGAN